jgi:MFS family permease
MAGVPLVRPLLRRDFRLLWIGAGTSLLGDGAYLVALAWQAYSLTREPAGLAILGVCATVPQVLALIAGGVISDRFDRRQVLLWADVARAVAVGAVGFLVVSGQVQMWHLASLSVVYGLGAGIAAPAFDAIVPDLVPEDDLEQANALDQFLRPAMLRLAGPAVGGLLVAVAGAGSSFLLNAASFVVSAACLAAIRRGARATSSTSSGPDDDAMAPSLLQDALSGFRFVRERVWLWGTFVAATVAYLLFIGPTEVLLPYVVREELGGSAGDLGIVLASGGVGAIAAAVLVGMTGLPRRQFTFMYVTWTAATLAVAGYGVAAHRWELAVTCLAVNGLEAAGTIAWATTKQRLIPNHLMGRVSSLDWLISIAGLPISYALTAPAAAVLGARTTLVAAGVVGGAVTLAALFLPGMRAVDGVLASRTPTAAGALEPA